MGKFKQMDCFPLVFSDNNAHLHMKPHLPSYMYTISSKSIEGLMMSYTYKQCRQTERKTDRQDDSYINHQVLFIGNLIKDRSRTCSLTLHVDVLPNS